MSLRSFRQGGVGGVFMGGDDVNIPKLNDENHTINTDFGVVGGSTKFVGYESPVRSILFFQASKRVVTCSPDKIIRIFDIETGKLEKAIEVVRGVVRMIIYGHDSFLTFHDKGMMNIYSFPTLELVKKIEEFRGNAKSVARFSDNSLLIVSGTYNNSELLYLDMSDENNVIKKKLLQKIPYSFDNYSLIIRSLFEENVFYTSCGIPGESDQILRIDVTSDKLLGKWRPDSCLCIFSFGLMMGKREKEELLVIAGEFGKISLCKTKPFELIKLIRSSTSSNVKLACVGQLCILGNSSGKMAFFDQERFEEMENEERFKDDISIFQADKASGYSFSLPIEIIKILKVEKRRLIVGCSIDNGTFKIFRFESNKYVFDHGESGLEEQDLKDRVEFLRNRIETIFDNSESEVMKINLMNCHDFKFLKLLLLL